MIHIKSVVKSLRLSPIQAVVIAERAKSEKMTVSEWLIRCVRLYFVYQGDYERADVFKIAVQ